MKKLVLFSVAMLLAAFSVKAQQVSLGNDITPLKYVFNELTDLVDGDLYPFGGTVKGWWPSKQWPALTGDNQFEGFLGISNGSDSIRNEIYMSGTSILDMGGSIGNVLCIRGGECPDNICPTAPKCDFNLAGGSWNVGPLMYSFCTSRNENDEKPNVFKVVMNVKVPGAAPTWGIIADQGIRIYEHTTGDLKLGVATTKLNFEDFGTEDEWLEIIFKYNHSTEPLKDGSTPSPTEALIFDFSPSTLKGGAYLIKEISFYNDPTFTDKEGTFSKRLIKFAPSSIEDIKDDAKISYTLKDGQMSLSNLKVGAKIRVYSLGGILMNELTASDITETISLDKGYYTVNVDGQNIKVLN